MLRSSIKVVQLLDLLVSTRRSAQEGQPKARRASALRREPSGTTTADEASKDPAERGELLGSAGSAGPTRSNVQHGTSTPLLCVCSSWPRRRFWWWHVHPMGSTEKQVNDGIGAPAPASFRNWIASAQFRPPSSLQIGAMMHRMRMPPMQQLSHPERTSVGTATSKSSSLRAMRVPKFLRSLYDILHYEDQSILTWSKDGTYFQIFDTKRLEIVVLPKYFKHGKFASFQRQLNNFGFRKWTKTQSSVCTFSHHHLVRCHPQQLAEFISRRPSTNGVRSVVDASSTAKRKRTFTELMRSADVGVSSTASKTIKRESDIYNRASQSTETDSLSITANSIPTKCAPRWVTDLVGFLKASEGNNGTPTSSSSEQTFNFSVDELHDIILPVYPLSERQDSRSIEKMLELRMLNECLDLGATGSLYAASSHGSGEPFPSFPYSWDSDTFFAPVARSHFEQERGPWRSH